MFCLYMLPLAWPAQPKAQTLTTCSGIVTSIPWNLINLSHLYCNLSFFRLKRKKNRHSRDVRLTVGQIPPKCKEISNLMWFSLIWFILVLFVCWNLFWTVANLRIKCVTETKNVPVLFYKNLKSNFSTRLTHLTLRFLYILGYSGPRCACCFNGKRIMSSMVKFFP